MGVTQKEMAEKLNVSQSQVARALRGGGRVAEETRLRVLKMASELGYDATTNSAARAMAGKRHGQKPKNGIMAVMFEEFLTETSLTMPRSLPFYEEVFEGFEDEALELGLDVCSCRARAHEIPRLVRENKVDGVISLGYRQENIQRTREAGLPVVLLQDVSDETHNVLQDDYDGIRQATEHLLNLGHRRIAYINIYNPTRQPVVQRRKAYLDTMLAHGITVPDEWIIEHLWAPLPTRASYCAGCDRCAACMGWDALKTRNGITDGRDNFPFTAIICYNDAVAMGVIRHAEADGLSVPNDLSVVGFDNISAAYNFTPRITSINFSRYQLGREALNLLHSIVQESEKEAPEPPGLQERVLPVQLEIHDTTRALAVAPGEKAERKNDARHEVMTLAN